MSSGTESLKCLARSVAQLADANPYDNASCESFMKTLKREEIYANDYLDLEHLRSNIETFIETYYNRCRLHSALGYQPPDEFEQQLKSTATNTGATMTFFSHAEDHRPDGANEDEYYLTASVAN